MNFNLTEEQRALAETVQRFLAQQYGFEARRRILRSPEGWSRETWGQLAEMGLLALQVPPEHGGMAPAAIETMLTLNAMGRALLVEPYLSSAVLGSALVGALGSPAQQEALLPAMAEGRRIVVPAHGEAGARYDLSRVATAARRGGAGWVLSGRKAVVLHAPRRRPAAGHRPHLRRGRRRSAGLSVFAVPPGTPGVQADPLSAHRRPAGRRRGPRRRVARTPTRCSAPRARPSRRWRRPGTWGWRRSAPRRWACSRPPSTPPPSTPGPASSSACPSPASRRSSTAWPTCSCTWSRPAP